MSNWKENKLKENGWKKSAYDEDKWLRGSQTVKVNDRWTDFGTSKNHDITKKLFDKKTS